MENPVGSSRTGENTPEAHGTDNAPPRSRNELYPADLHTLGTEAGFDPSELMQLPSVKGSGRVTCIDYCPERYRVEEVPSLPDFLMRHRPEWSAVRWINVHGLEDMEAIRAIAEKYELHPLAIEDVLSTQRPKLEDYPGSGEHPGRLFLVARVIRVSGRRLVSKQISFFLGRHTLITFQDTRGGLFHHVRQRIRTTGSRIRSNDVSFLLYSLLDAIVDDFFPLLEGCAERIQRLERRVLARPTRKLLARIHRLRNDIMTIRRVAWPMRELILELRREEHECFSENTRTYLRDVYDHILIVFELIESYRDVLSTLTETYMSSVSNRMNDIMKTLTIISTIFVPLTFLAGVYGMNMPIPENEFRWSYPIFWGVSLSVIFFMVWWFRRRHWF
jgi:magnesium transporter